MKALFIASLAAAVLTAVPAANAADVGVMTQNQYLGADIAPLVEPGIPASEFDARLAAALQQVATNNAADRIAAQAALITARRPHLVGLQEVFSFECTPTVGDVGCTVPVVAAATNDHLALLLAELGDSYRVVAQVTNLNIALPSLVLAPGLEVSIRVIDRDVILARKDVEANVLPLACPRPQAGGGCNYQVVAPIIALGASVERGYVAALATVNHRPYIFLNTHLETREPVAYFQAAQAAELVQVIQSLKGLGIPLIVVGDFNSSPNDPPFIPDVLDSPYSQLTDDADLLDAWLGRPGNVPGLTCCQAADLSNHRSQLYERVDLIWSSEPPWKVKQARVEGDTVNTKTPPPGRGLWPSDHGAVAATLQFR